MTFNLSEVTVSEADRVATLKIVKQGINNVPVTFTLSTLNGTARGRYTLSHSPTYQYIGIYYSILQYTAAYVLFNSICSNQTILHYTTLYYSILQYTTVYYSILS